MAIPPGSTASSKGGSRHAPKVEGIITEHRVVESLEAGLGQFG
jgi:hypothetical protein